MIKLYVPSLICLIASISFDAKADEATKKLQINPITCIKNKTQEFCSLTASVKVEFEQPTNFCLVAKHIEYKRCFNATLAHQEVINLELKQDTFFQLYDEKNELIAAQMLSIAVIKDKKTRPRRNLGWVLF